MKQVFEKVEEDFYGPSLTIQVVDDLWGEGHIEDIGQVEAPGAFVEQPHQPDVFVQKRLLGLGQLDRHIQPVLTV